MVWRGRREEEEFLFLDVDRRLRGGPYEVLVHLRHDAVVAGRRVPHPGRCGAVGHGEVGGVGGVARPHHRPLRWWRGNHLVVARVAVPGWMARRQVVVREVRGVRGVRVVGLGRPRHPHGRMLAVVGVVGVLLDHTQQLSSAQSLPLVPVDRRPPWTSRTLQTVLHLGREARRSVPRGGQGRTGPG